MDELAIAGTSPCDGEDLMILARFHWLCALLLGCSSLYSEEETREEKAAGSSLRWHDQYEEASEQAKKEGKPLLLFFSGSDWCSWCTRLEEEVLTTQAFAQEVAEQFVFVRLDFPLYSTLHPQIAAQNKQLRRKYDIRTFPAVVLLDERGNKMGMAFYRSGGGVEYARHLESILKGFRCYQEQLAQLQKGLPLEGGKLRKLYEQAKSYQQDNEAIAILKEGLKRSDDLFFLKERYRFLADEGHIHTPEARQLKVRLESLDSQNQQHTLYELAMIEFEAYCDEMAKESYSPELAAAPLVEYIEKYGERDRDHIWRLEMLIAQLFLNNNQLSKALLHAKSCYRAAPETVRPEIAGVIENLQVYQR